MFHFTGFGILALSVLNAACQSAPKAETSTMGAKAETSAMGDRPAPASAGLSAEDEAAIRALDAQWGRASSAGDANALASLYASDATVLPPNEPMRQGEAAKKYWIDITNSFSGPTELTPTAVGGGGDLAYAVGTYRATLTPRKAGAKPLPTEEGKYLEVLRKQADGSWKIIYDMWSPNAAPGKQ
jgi:uncharacterized protein (TIGR02246 family)